MPDHGVALAVAGGGILLMCECGWHSAAPEVTTFDYVAELVNGHRGAEHDCLREVTGMTADELYG